MLLTSGQVSMAISSGIVFLFTSLLFLSGYVLQQQTVRGLQQAIKPRLPKPVPPPEPTVRHVPNPNARVARQVGSQEVVDAELQAYLDATESSINWARLAYAQLVRDHAEVCSAVMLLSELHRQRSPARRVLLFPKEWLAEAKEDEFNPYQETTRRLLRLAARRYGVALKPLDPMVEGADGSLPSSYSIASLYALTEFEKIMYLPPPGYLLDALPFDSLLAFSRPRSLSTAMNGGDDAAELTRNSVLLISPSSNEYSNLKTLRTSSPMADAELLKQAFPFPSRLVPPPPLLPSDLVADSTWLRNEEMLDFNATRYFDTTGYVRLSDPELPGPEYDMPFNKRVQIRPKDPEARMAWERLYESFRQRRMEVCGLDLETWTRVEIKPAVLAAPRLGEAGENVPAYGQSG